MIEKTCCESCDDTSGVCVYPYYGLAPHIHTKPIFGTEILDQPYPENFSPDGDGMGIWTHCLNCGADGSESQKTDLPESVKQSLKEIS
jgi:hypothetical protein